MYKPVYAKESEDSSAKVKQFLLIVVLSLLFVLAIILVIAGRNTSKQIGGAESLPWENGGKQPIDYTWDEYLALDDFAKDPFFESFASAEEFEIWMISAGSNMVQTNAAPILPWESGGKLPHEYTKEEYLALSDEVKDAFYESFASPEEFDAWMVNCGMKASEPDNSESTDLPYDGMQPNEYTWQDYESMTPEEKELFYESFDSPAEFELWLNAWSTQRLQADVNTTESSDGSSELVSVLTWDEFESLTPEQQETFFLSFSSPDAFEAWMLKVKQ